MKIENKYKENEEVPLDRVKHPLENTWCFWFFSNNGNKTWEENLIQLTTFSTVEDYWCLYHHMKFPSQLPLGQDYAIFKEGISPKWEDPANRHGGRIIITLHNRRGNLDKLWLDLTLLVIGNNFGKNNNIICGVYAYIRVKSKISIWISNETDKKAIEEIVTKVKEQLGVYWKVVFQAHESMTKMYTL